MHLDFVRLEHRCHFRVLEASEVAAKRAHVLREDVRIPPIHASRGNLTDRGACGAENNSPLARGDKDHGRRQTELRLVDKRADEESRKEAAA